MVPENVRRALAVTAPDPRKFKPPPLRRGWPDRDHAALTARTQGHSTDVRRAQFAGTWVRACRSEQTPRERITPSKRERQVNASRRELFHRNESNPGPPLLGTEPAWGPDSGAEAGPKDTDASGEESGGWAYWLLKSRQHPGARGTRVWEARCHSPNGCGVCGAAGRAGRAAAKTEVLPSRLPEAPGAAAALAVPSQSPASRPSSPVFARDLDTREGGPPVGVWARGARRRSGGWSRAAAAAPPRGRSRRRGMQIRNGWAARGGRGNEGSRISRPERRERNICTEVL